MSRRRSIATIRTLAETAENESARALSERRRRLDAELERLAQLRTYLAEYRALSTAGDGLLIDVVRARRDFVARIEQGIEEQQRIVDALRAQIDADQVRWREARTRTLAMTRLGERLDEAAAEREQRRERSALDEVGRRMFRGNDG